ncbi:MAG: DegV family protein [Chloroflexi bacterium]|nr:DegV family protein [Chloroflexota bacterium]
MKRCSHIASVAIVTDSTSSLPQELISQYGIYVAPVGMVIDGKHYRDQIDITAAEFLDMSGKLTKQPSTTAANPGDFLAIFRELGKSTKDIVCILVSRALSATQESAYQAKRMIRSEIPDLNVEIFDSKTSIGALGFIVLEAARAAQQGKSREEVLKVARDMSLRVVYLATVDSLKYLINIGRAPKNATSVGELLQVKPVIGFIDDTGLLEIVARVRGRGKAVSKILDLVEEYADTRLPLHANVHYTHDPAQAEQLKQSLVSRYKCSEVYVTQFSPVMIGAVGPLVGLSFYS